MAASSEGSFNSTSSLFPSNHPQNSELSGTNNISLASEKNCDNQRVCNSVSGSNLDSDSQTSSMVVFVNHPNKDIQDLGISQGRTISGSVHGHGLYHSFPSDTSVVSSSNCISCTKEQVVNQGCEVQKVLAGQHSGQFSPHGIYAQPNSVPHIVTQEGNSFGQNNTFSTNHSQNHLTMSFENEVVQSPYYSTDNGRVAHGETLGIHSNPQSGWRSFAGDNTFVTYSPGSRQSLQTVQLASKGDVFQNSHNSTQMMSVSTNTSPLTNNAPQANSNVTLVPARSPSLPRQSPESLSFDLGDLQGLEPFDVDILDSDIHVLSDYFLSSEDSSSERFPPVISTENLDSSRNSANLMEHLNPANPQLSSANENPGSTLERTTSGDDSLRVMNGFRNDTVTNNSMQSSTEAPNRFQARKDGSTSLYAGSTFSSTDPSSIKSLTGTTPESSWSSSIDSFLNKRPGKLMSVDGQFLATHTFDTHQTALESIQTVNKSHVPWQKTGNVSVGTKRQTHSDTGDEQILGNQSNLISNDINMETVSDELKNDHHSARTTSFKVVAADNLLNVNNSFSVGSDSPKSSGAQVHVEFATSDISLNSVDHLLLQSESLVNQAILPNDTQYKSKSVARSLHSTNNSPQSSFTNSLSSQASQYQFSSSCVPGSASIIDYSPEWSYPEGGVKVLVTGEWYNRDASYTCLFDGCSVPASLIQSGCLRCFCPSHDPGLVTLQVASNGFIVSNACVFEYRVKDSPGGQGSFHEWLAMDEGRFKVAILERLERLESRLNPAQQKTGMGFSNFGSRHRNSNFEERLVSACHFISSHEIVDCSLEAEILYRGMSVLHLAAALGFDKLVQNLLQWRKQTTNEIILQELNPQRKDKFSCTPLMWACALGHTKVVVMLLECDSDVLVVADARGRLPLQVARDRGYLDVVDAIQLHVSDPSSSTKSTMDYDNDPSNLSPGESLNCASTASPKSSSLSDPDNPESPLQMTLTDISDNDSDMRATNRGSSATAINSESVMSVSGKQINTLGKALNHVKALIREAEQEADTDGGQPNTRSTVVTVPLSPVQEGPSLMTGSTPGWGTTGMLVSFSSASAQSSPVTPSSSRSSLSPGSPGFLNSPHSSSGVSTDTKEFHEFLCSSRKWLEKDFSELTLTDLEQRELYQAARIIQNAYRSYKIRCQQQEQELQAAILIQNHYRRYKQFALIKKMTKAAKIIQNQYRAYREHEQFKRSRQAAAVIQSYFRNYRQRRQCRRDDCVSKRQEARFLRQSSNRSTTF